jgi:hypothetical protein
MTIRKDASALASPNMKLWDLDAAPGTILANLENKAYLAALDAIDKLEAHRAEAAKSGQFTEAGLTENAKKFALTQLAPALHRGRLEIAAAKKEAAELRNKLTLQPPDKTDLVGVMRRQEIRAWLRSLPDQKRRDYIAGNLEHLSPEMALAIIEAPAELSGVLGADRQVLVDTALRAQHGDAITVVVELERAIKIASHAVETVRTEIARDVGVKDPHEWNRKAAPHEKRATAPYLKKFVENGAEVVRVMKWNGNGGTWGAPTPEQLTDGVYYGSFQEYQNAHRGEQP